MWQGFTTVLAPSQSKFRELQIDHLFLRDLRWETSLADKPNPLS
jgi:hypothetical protein